MGFWVESVFGVAGAVSSSAMVEMSLGELWKAKDPRETRRREEEAIPKISPSLSFRHVESGMFSA